MRELGPRYGPQSYQRLALPLPMRDLSGAKADTVAAAEAAVRVA